MSFLYFAYGSNMLTTRLMARCPSATPIEIAMAHGYGMKFTKVSNDKSGKATLVRTDERECVTPGVLFEIAKSELNTLDRAEGVGSGYDRIDDFEVTLSDTGKYTSVSTYFATKTDNRLIPYDWYLALVIAGALEHGLDIAHVGQLRQIEFNVDSYLSRPTRKDALKALTAHGYDDHNALLTGF